MFEINKTLRKDILQDLPRDISKTGQACYIYKQLCDKLEYSMDYFLDEDSVASWFTNPDNLKKVDGRDNNRVVCFTFNPIFAQLLIDAKICPDDLFEKDSFIGEDGKLRQMHMSMLVLSDDHLFAVDSTDGLMDRCDLTSSSFNECRYTGWEVLGEGEYKEEGEAILKRAKKEAYGVEDMLKNLGHAYMNSKGNEYSKMTLQDRFDLFMEYLDRTPPYSIETFAHMLRMRTALFTPRELGKLGQKQQFELSFVKNASNHELKAMILYNPEGYVDDPGYENFDTLQIYEYRPKSNTLIKNVDRQELIRKLYTGEYTGPKGFVARPIEMIKEGIPWIFPVAPDGEELQYDEDKNPINVDHYERREKATGFVYTCDKNGKPLDLEKERKKVKQLENKTQAVPELELGGR